MLQNPCKTLGFKKNMVYKIPPGGGGKPYPASGLDVFFRFYNPPPPPPPLGPSHMLYIYIMTFNCPGGILDLGGKHLKQTERHQFHLLNDKHHNFKYISYACVEGIL